MNNKQLFCGISAPQLTPFNADGSINYSEYTRLTGHIVKSGVNGIFVCGTTGEFVNLTIDERRKLLDAARAGAEPQTHLLYNITALNLTDLKTLAEHAKTHGATAVSVTPPYYHSYDETALVRYFITAARIAAPLPLYLYNIPGMAKNAITPEAMKKICAACPNVRGIKDSSMDFMTFLRFQLAAPDEDFEVITGNDAQVLTALQAGGNGAVVAIASVFPDLCCQISRRFAAGDLQGAREAQSTVLELRELARSVMPIMAHKEMLRLQGFEMGPARFPMRDLTQEERERIKQCLQRAKLV